MLMSAVFAQSPRYGEVDEAYSDCNKDNWQEYNYGKDMIECDLRGADLSGANLIGANLTGADLTGADLTEADLTDAKLEGAHLFNAVLVGADLTGADLTGANLIDAILSDALLNGAKFQANVLAPDFDLTDVQGRPLSGDKFDQALAKLRIWNISTANLNYVDLTGAYLPKAEAFTRPVYLYTENKGFVGARFSTKLGFVNLESADLTGADLTGADLTNAELNGVKSGEIKGRPLSLPDGWSLVDGTLYNDEGENLNSPDDMMDDGDDLKFENIDTDSDGCISEDEFNTYDALDDPDDMMDDGDDPKFEDIDTDSDGCISEKEFEKAKYDLSLKGN